MERLKDLLSANGIAICGKDVTENIGIEKIVLNVISNPNIRFLILCGQDSLGHEVGQALISLVENGVDEEGRIIGAIGSMPILKNLTQQQIETFRKQVKIVDLRGCEEVDKILAACKECEEKNPGPFKIFLEQKGVKELIAYPRSEKEFKPDKLGYFVITLKPETKEIFVEHYSYSHKLQHVIRGKNAKEICDTLLREGLVSELSHAFYLGRELTRAEHALKNNLHFEQEKG